MRIRSKKANSIGTLLNLLGLRTDEDAVLDFYRDLKRTLFCEQTDDRRLYATTRAASASPRLRFALGTTGSLPKYASNSAVHNLAS